MAPPNAAGAVTAGAVDDPRVYDLPGGWIDPEHRSTTPDLQAEHLRRRFMMPASIARIVAELCFGRAEA